MRIHPCLKSWVGTVTRNMPHLSKPQAKVLAMWSFGIVITQSSGLTTVLIFLAKLLDIKKNTVRQRLIFLCVLMLLFLGVWALIAQVNFLNFIFYLTLFLLSFLRKIAKS